MEGLMLLVVAAILIEAIVETVKLAMDGGIQRWYVVAFGVGVTVSVVYGLDLFALVGFTSALLPPVASSIVGSVLTGVVIGRGSNFVSDLIGRVNAPAEQ